MCTEVTVIMVPVNRQHSSRGGARGGTSSPIHSVASEQL